MKKLLFVFPIVALLAAGCSSNKPVVEQNQQATTPPADTQIKQTATPPANPEFILNSKVEKIVGDAGSVTMVTYSVSMTEALSKSSSDWTIQIACPQGVVIASVEGGGKCPTAQLKANGAPSTSFRFKNQTDSVQKVIATARLLSGKDGQTPVAVSENTVEIPAASWKDVVYNQFFNLTDWKVQDNLSAWQFADYTYEKERSTQLKKYGAGGIILLSKSFNENGFVNPGDDQKAYTDQKVLEDSIKKVLSDNGWVPVAWPTEPGFYTDYLYVKDNHPLDFQVGTRDAVTGGMFVRIEFQY